MLNRRAFLKQFGIGVAAACALASLPEAAVKALGVADAGRLIACEYLRKVHNEWCAAHPGCFPTRMQAGAQLFEAYESEIVLNMRFTTDDTCGAGPRSLAFKAARLDPVGSGWRAEIVAFRDMRIEMARAS